MHTIKWLAALGIAISLGCSSSSSRTPTTPTDTPQARLELTVSPTTVGYAGGPGTGGAICPVPYTSRWGPFAWTLRETGGLPVTVTSFRWKVLRNDGAVESDEEIISGMAGDFGLPAAPTVRVAANATLNSRQHYDCELTTNGRPDFPGGSAVFTVTATDDAGVAINSTATLTLLPPS